MTLPKSKLIHGVYYKGRCRNASIARWNAQTNRFVHWRTKLTMVFLEEINHPEDDNGFDLFKVERVATATEIAALPEEIEFETGPS